MLRRINECGSRRTFDCRRHSLTEMHDGILMLAPSGKPARHLRAAAEYNEALRAGRPLAPQGFS